MIRARTSRCPTLLFLLFPAFLTPPLVAQTNETGPAPVAGACMVPEARQFDFWAGEWNVLNRQLRRSDGEWFVTGSATMKGHPAAGGCAFVEHWQGTTAGGRTLGFSLRSFDPATGTWTILLNWPRPDRASFSRISGAFRHGRGEFFFDFLGADSTPTRGRFSFSDISPRTLRWDQAFSTDSGKSWLTTWIMEFSRRDPAAPALINGPAPLGGYLMCTAEEARAMDFVTGEWTGVDSLAPGPDSVVSLEAFPIVGGCASVVRITRATPGGGRYDRFQVQSFVVADDDVPAHWEQFSLDSESPLLVESEGSAAEGELIFTSREGERRRRERWSPGESGQTLRLMVEESGDGGKSYHLVSRVSFNRRI